MTKIPSPEQVRGYATGVLGLQRNGAHFRDENGAVVSDTEVLAHPGLGQFYNTDPQVRAQVLFDTSVQYAIDQLPSEIPRHML